MSFVRASEKMRYSNYDESLYSFLSGGPESEECFIESYGDLSDPEAFCEVMFRVLEQSGVEVDLETVNKVRERLNLEKLEEIGQDYELSQEFEEMMERLDEEFEDE